MSTRSDQAQVSDPGAGKDELGRSGRETKLTSLEPVREPIAVDNASVAARDFGARGERYRRPMNFGLFVGALWRARSLVWVLSERELRARYKQAFLGIAWAFLSPLTYVLVFTLIFNRVTNVDTRGVPYYLFTYVGLIPWGFFSSTLTIGSLAPLSNVTLMNKVACPREIFTIAAVTTASVDAAITALALPIMFLFAGFVPRATSLWVPVILAIQLAFGLGLALLLGSVLFYVRDVRHALPVVAQMLLFATPVAYDFSAIPASWRLTYSILNPMAPVIDAYRETILFGQAPHWQHLGPAAGVSFALLGVGYLVFKRLETGFADVA